MTARLLLVGALASGCWAPFSTVDDDLVPIVADAGRPPQGRDAQVADASVADAAVADAGTPLPTNAAIAPVAGPPPAACGSLRAVLGARLANDAGCGNGCLFTVDEQTSSLAFVSGRTAADTVWFTVEGGLSADWVVFTSYRDGLGRRLVAKSRRSNALFQLQPLGTGNVSVVGRWLGSTFHYVVTEWAPVAGSPRRSTLRAWHSATPIESEVVAELPSPLGAGFGINSLTAYAYVLALDDGLYEVPLYGANRRARQVIAVPDVSALVVTDTGPFAYGTRSGAVVYGTWGSTVQHEVVATGLEAASLGVLGYGELAVFDRERGIFTIDTASRTTSLLYAQRDFVQGHHFIGEMLVPDFSGQISVSEICHLDADAPTYGTVALEPPLPLVGTPARRGSARWVTGTPEWPWQVPVLDSPPWDRPLDRESLTGAFLLRVVGP
ncbi:MAG: hypothetical protein MUC96_00960 [Myxococcaceae bacterium]|jgi:hypothetical protein|nr:hypothetical protein [Myxococcaceae bacterium]